MKHIYSLLTMLMAVLTVGCVDNPDYTPQNYAPVCRQETMVAVYDEQGTYTVPGCADYYMPQTYTASVVNVEQIAEGTVPEPQKEPEPQEEEFDINDVEGEFPTVENNKYIADQVVMQNQNTRVLAYCRGTQQEIAACVERLENSCYVRITDVPRLPAKYDMLKTGTYPTRRWRNGESVPRW